jgi:uncharacterized membrane protein YgdD (TMEM256/DUF423 family)
MKKVGFKRRINWDWENPLAIFFIIFTGIGIISALLVTAMSAWNTPAILAPAIFGGIGMICGFIALVISLTRD